MWGCCSYINNSTIMTSYPYLFPFRLFCVRSATFLFGSLDENPSNLPTLKFLFFNHHSASGRLPSRKGRPLPGLPPNLSAACLSALHAAHSTVLPTTCCPTPCHSSCGNIGYHFQPVPAWVAKITLSRTLGVHVTSVAISVFNAWSCCDRQAPLDVDPSYTNFLDGQDGA